MKWSLYPSATSGKGGFPAAGCSCSCEPVLPNCSDQLRCSRVGWSLLALPVGREGGVSYKQTGRAAFVSGSHSGLS